MAWYISIQYLYSFTPVFNYIQKKLGYFNKGKTVIL
jgi:hypothetical protein